MLNGMGVSDVLHQYEDGKVYFEVDRKRYEKVWVESDGLSFEGDDGVVVHVPVRAYDRIDVLWGFHEGIRKIGTLEDAASGRDVICD